MPDLSAGSLMATIVGLFEGRHRRSVGRISVIVLYLLIDFGLCIQVVVSALNNPMRGVLGDDLLDACKPYNKVIPISVQAILDQVKSHHLSRSQEPSSTFFFW